MSLKLVLVKIFATLFSVGENMSLLYEDEDQILPLLLHRVDSGQKPCSCRDCLGIRDRMRQLNLDVDQFSARLVA
ncbi:hypothetical protein SynWH8103_01511 [Synechococcus sp. WH 8103]|nr:hypothetical protein SynA18461_01545 [Synechococcus sp. A18-46.1]CRY92238.1 hypothetical protein SynWH8103_01511 [Synechococcus sp. WH 8103]